MDVTRTLGAGCSLAPSPFIRYCKVDSRVILLHLQTGKYFMFDVVGSRIWDLMTSKVNVSTAATEIATFFGMDEGEVERDVSAFIHNCLLQGFLIPSARQDIICSKTIMPRCSLSTWDALKCIYNTKYQLKKRGFPSVYVAYSEMAQLSEYKNACERDLTAAFRSFQRAENFFGVSSSGIDCLPRSLAFFLFLCSAGIRATHHIGVKRFPFAAHAWVEAKGKLLLDSTTFVNQFVTISEI